MTHQNRIALVTGANRGIGLEVSKQLSRKGYQILLGCRDLTEGRKALSQFDATAQITPVSIDVSNDASCDALMKTLKTTVDHIDVLVNNAGVLVEPQPGLLSCPLSAIQESIDVNTYGAIRLTQRLLPMMLAANYGRIVNVSSGMGQLTDMNGGWPGYRISKTALNAVTRIFADELQGKNILVNSVCPGWVKTRMGGEEAERTPEQGADTIVWLATLPDGGPTGGFFRDREPISW